MPFQMKLFYPIVVLSVGFQYGLLFSKFSRELWQGVDTVTLAGISVMLLALTYTYFVRFRS